MSDLDPLLDRRQYLLGPSPAFNGIDYVEVASADQTVLRVHFLNRVAVDGTLGTTLTSPPSSPPADPASAVTITGGEVITAIAVLAGSAQLTRDSEDRPVLTVQVESPGDFSTYQLAVESAVLDPFFSSVPFSFKANCTSDFDCAPAAPVCPPPPPLDVPIDYLAKDFTSFRQALSEFSTQRYPDWVERSEADLGMVVMEILAAAADELSYYQDRIAGESLLATATQPLSLLRHARLVDYEPAPATVASVQLQLEVTPGTTAITAPLRCQALGADGGVIDFEVGNGLAAPGGGPSSFSFAVDARWNRYSPGGEANLLPYWWDGSRRCLAAGSQQFDVIGHGFGLADGVQLLVDTAGATSADDPVREVVVVSGVPQEIADPVFGQLLTRVSLAAPTTTDHDLTRTVFAGNLVPATQGVRVSETFAIPEVADPCGCGGAGSGGAGSGGTGSGAGGSTGGGAAPAVVRFGADWTPDDAVLDYRYSLASGPLAWIAAAQPDPDVAFVALPELVLLQDPGSADPAPWTFVRWLLDAGAADAAFTLTPEQYSPVLASAGRSWFDYDGGGGTTIRFGNGDFGQQPAPGTLFSVTYRVGGGSVGNVPADAIVRLAPGAAPVGVTACTNPFAATGGRDAETPQQIRDAAPQYFRADPLRVVRVPDYESTAQTLPWVQQAGTSFRWTGSWLTVLTAANPRASEQPTVGEVGQLTDLLNRRRLAGYESYVLPPRYVSVDLSITLCGDPDYFAADIEAAVLQALRPATPGGPIGFFDHSRWSFGQPLESSALLAAVQSVVGVQGVSCVQFRQRGVQDSFAPLPETLSFAADQVLRVDDDPSRPEAGSLSVTVQGAK